MTENEAIKEIRNEVCNEKGVSERCHDRCMYGKEKCAYSMAMAALEEIQQYREIEREIKEQYHSNVDIKILMRYFIETIFKGEKHEGFYILTNEDAKEWDEYQLIGTVEECREARERQIPKKPNKMEYKPLFDFGWWYACPSCDCAVGANEYDGEFTQQDDYCATCGQKLDWSE